MTEKEFRALLAVEGKTLKVEKLVAGSLYYIAVVLSIEDIDYARYSIGTTPKSAVKKLIKEYYADN